MLLKIYIGQEVNYSRGILYKFKDQLRFDENQNKIIESLIHRSLIAEKQAYVNTRAIITLVTTKAGKEEAKKHLLRHLQDVTTMIKEIDEFPKKALGFLLVNLDTKIFGKDREEFVFDWKEFILYKTKMFEYALKFCQLLEKNNLAVLTNDYVSSHGGRIDPEVYVIPIEVSEYLTKNLNPKPFDYEETKQALLFYTLFSIKNDFLNIKDEERRRNNYWNLLRTLPFDESVIKSIVSQFQRENITTEYSEIGNERFLFSILDHSRFNIKLEKMIETFISEVIEGKRAELNVNLPYEPSELLRTHSELFAKIGNFEMRFREGLISEMRTAFKENKDEWYDGLKEIKLIGDELPHKTIYDKLESRRNEDLRNKILPETELIYYADITDYKDIILKNWNLFETRFKRIGLSKEKFEHGMTELNKVRRKVMHLRDIRPPEAKTLLLFIIPELEKIFQ